MSRAVLWFRRDLRLEDLPALHAAADRGDGTVVPLFVDSTVGGPRPGPNQRSFIASSLRALDERMSGALVLRRGDPATVVPAVAAEVGAEVVTVTTEFEPVAAAIDAAVATHLAAAGRRLLTVGSPYAVPPGVAASAPGQPYRVFSAFLRAWEHAGWDRPVPAPPVSFESAASDTSLDRVAGDDRPTPGDRLPDWWEGLPLSRALRLPPGGETAATERLDAFASGALDRYALDRDLPARDGTSGLSPHLRAGCVHPRQVLARLGGGGGAERLRVELAWREFYASVLWHLPSSADTPLQPFGSRLRWDDDAQARHHFAAWARGLTGYPLVDAGMRQLLAEGWMPNRVRMVVASFLVKDLHIDWRLGARWFMWHLVDADIASNQHNWQWVAGTGTDAAPFFRVLNPMLQQQRFDPDGGYVGRWVPEARDGSGSYPSPIVDHAHERRDTLARFAAARVD